MQSTPVYEAGILCMHVRKQNHVIGVQCTVSNHEPRGDVADKKVISHNSFS